MTPLELTVRCTYCRADINQPCQNLATHQPLKHTPAHICRIKLAEQQVPF